MVKRAFDIILILAISPLLIPLSICLALLVRSKLGSPVFFPQTRPGLHGAPFQLLKFRTMTDDRDENGKLKPDSQRLTRFGQWMRSLSLDELPEFWNVLKGDMSLVGPRPLLMEYLDYYTPEQARRHDVLPGLTGWAQVKGRNALTWEQKFDLDIWYVDNASLWLDIKILLLTAVAVFRRDGISAPGHATMPPFRGNKPEK